MIMIPDDVSDKEGGIIRHYACGAAQTQRFSGSMVSGFHLPRPVTKTLTVTRYVDQVYVVNETR